MLSPLTAVFPFSISLRKTPYSVGTEDLFHIHSDMSALSSSRYPCSKQENIALTSGTIKNLAKDVKSQRMNNWVSDTLESTTPQSFCLRLRVTNCH